jgi:hypothetical protein
MAGQVISACARNTLGRLVDLEPRRKDAAMEYYRIEIRLLDVKPPPWRQFLLKKTATFEKLHAAIQDACGWSNYHLYAFRETDKGPAIAGIPDDSYTAPDPDAKRVKLSSFFTAGGPARCIYQYDFGDDWWHEVRILEVASMPKRFVRQLLAGGRAFPLEDCGGVAGYLNCVAVVQDKATGEIDNPEELRKWLGDWHPEHFDLAAAKQRFDC